MKTTGDSRRAARAPRSRRASASGRRAAQSGFSSATALTASKPLAHSATISTPGWPATILAHHRPRQRLVVDDHDRGASVIGHMRASSHRGVDSRAGSSRRQRHLDPPDAVRFAADMRAPCRRARAGAPARCAGRGRCRCRRGRSASHGILDDNRQRRRRALGAGCGPSPPSSTCATPCVTAFSTSGCSSSGGTRQASASSARRSSTCSRSPNRTCSIARKRRASASSRASGMRVARAERQALAEKVGEQQAHPPRRRRIRGRQRADRVQAVEEEVRIDLRAQRAQLRLARQHLQLQPAPLGVPRDCSNDASEVADRQRQQIEQEAEAEDQRGEPLEGRTARRALRPGVPAPRSSRARAAATRRC